MSTAVVMGERVSSISYPHQSSAAASTAAGCCAQQTKLKEVSLTQSRPEFRPNKNLTAMATCYTAYHHNLNNLPTTAVGTITPGVQQQQSSRTVQVPQQQQVKDYSAVPVQQKDYSRPLHVDCSVEYELPNTAKPPPGVRNEPLLMIHPCYFRKIESQRRSPFINNLPASRPIPAASTVKRRLPKGQQLPQQVPIQGAQYPVQYQDSKNFNFWEPMPPLVPISATAQSYCKREPLMTSCAGYTSSTDRDSGHWTDPECSPDRPDEKHVLSGKYRQYLRAHRLHPYVPHLGATFPHQIQQVCYNV